MLLERRKNHEQFTGNLEKERNDSFLCLVLLFIVVGCINPAFFTVGNISACFNSSVVFVIISVGMAFTIMIGEIDVSVGSCMGMTAVVVGTMICDGKNWILAFIVGILIGVIVTAIMQSSSAAVGVLQTLAAAGGVVTASSAMYISLGSNIGSCCTALLSSLGESRNAKRSAVIHLTFNVLGALVWGSGLFVLFQFRPAFGTMGIDSVGISVFHTIFNLVCTVLMTPLRGKLVALSGLLVKGGDEQEQAEQSDDAITLRHLDDRILETPSFAVENAILEVVHMGHIANEKYGTCL